MVALVRYTTGVTQTRVTAPRHYRDFETLEQLLTTRFARGEIDDTEYRNRLEVPHITPRH
ncbi:MAG TPA: hypothetical protein PKK01_17155 [Mycobacterium sp.]|jgi:uncharacterized membrane protein|nr:hypothetical protein [Mycobacterium sp.]HPZ94589.1 hypothetical protein [Mycobacterium sp.]